MEENDDSRLLEFNSYENYLDSFITREDLYYLGSRDLSRKIAELGYRSTSETLSREQFKNRRQAVSEILFPTRKLHILFSDGVKFEDPFLEALASRERSNRVGILSTIIFLRHHKKSGYELSGYIDFEHSLRHSRSKEYGSTDWTLVFSSKIRLWPQTTDLSYYNWRSGVSLSNDTRNYKVITDPVQGLVFINRHDRKTIITDPLIKDPGSNTTRTLILSNKYDHVVLYDHVLRNKT